jgi:putative transposase
MITAATYQKIRFFDSYKKLLLLQDKLFEAMQRYGWVIRAWAILANHYHFIAAAPQESLNLKNMIKWLHSQTASEINRMDNAPKRHVWFQYWDTCITYEDSYYPRLNYVNNNPVHHGIVASANLYPFTSLSWFESHDPDFARKIASYKYDKIQIKDDF